MAAAQTAMPVPAGATFGPAIQDTSAPTSAPSTAAIPVPAGATFGPALSDTSSGSTQSLSSAEPAGALGIGKVQTPQEVAAFAPKTEPIDPPRDHREEIVKTIAGDPGLSWYRYGRGAVAQVEQLLEPPKKGDAAGYYEKGKELVKRALSSIPQTAMANVTPQPHDMNPATHPLQAQPIAPGPGVASSLEGALGPELAAARLTPPVGLGFKNPFRGVVQGAKIAQEPAAAAVRTAAGATADTPILEGATTAVDSPITDLMGKKSAAYKQIDDEVGFDLKAEKERLADTNYAIKQPGADKAALQTEIDDSTQRIAQANAQLKAKGIDPTIADNLNKSWEAGKDFKKVLVRNTTSDGTINVKNLLNQSKAMRFSKYGDRLAQFFGKGDAAAGKVAAESYMNDLQEAQKEGIHAMKAQDFAKKLGKYAAYATAGAVGAAGSYEVGRATGVLP